MTGRRLALAAVVLAGALAYPGSSTPWAARQSPAPPRLIVMIVVDQFRADYLDWYGDQWTDGLARLFAEGAVFPRATIPWAVTKTCTGHASISTGTWPSQHGLVGNEWFDRSTDRLVGCTSDTHVAAIGLGGRRAVERHSARWLLVPTLAEQLRQQAPVPPRILSVALKPRAAIALAGQGGDGTVVFWEEDSGAWATSSAFASAPWPAVDTYLQDTPVDALRGTLWDRLAPAAAYRHEDRAAGEPSGSTLPRRLTTPVGVPFSAVWDASPLSDAYIAAMAAALTRRVALGQREGTDLLAIGFSALDYIGHAFGPRSHEVQDALLRLDRALGQLLATLDDVVGRPRYVVGLTSDHGVALLPEQAAAVTGTMGGRLDPSAVATAVTVALRARLGLRASVDAVTTTDLYLAPGVADAVAATPGLAKALTAAAEAVPGVARAFWTPGGSAPGPPADAEERAVRASVVAGRSGDLIFLPSANWVVAASGTNHGSLHDYDRLVPMVFFGGGIDRGRHAGGSPTDVAPTLARLAGVDMPHADGIVRSEVVGP